MNKLKIALQKSGRLHEESIKLINNCGINLNFCYKDKLRILARNFPVEIFFLRDDDIPKYIQEGIVDIGIAGKNVVCEQKKDFLIKEKLGFGACRLSLAVPKETIYKNIKDLSGKRIATTYPNLLKNYLEKYNICSEIMNLSGSVEIATTLDVADAICDIVDSGETLFKNNLKEIDQIYVSEAVLLCCPNYKQKALVELFLFRIQAVKRATTNKYILFYVPNENLDNILSFIIKNKSTENNNRPIPITVPVINSNYSYVQAIVENDVIFQTTYYLKINGAQHIVVFSIQNLII